MRSVDGPRRRRMIRGTIARISVLIMRHGPDVPIRDLRLPVLPTKHCHVCSAAPAVTTVYQRDSSSKRPRASVVSAVRTRPRASPGVSEDDHGVQGFAPSGRRLRRPWTPRSPSDKNAGRSAS
jgi:hypothetical protein